MFQVPVIAKHVFVLKASLYVGESIVKLSPVWENLTRQKAPVVPDVNFNASTLVKSFIIMYIFAIYIDMYIITKKDKFDTDTDIYI